MSSARWFETLRSILELLYFVAGIAIAGAAFWGLRQIRLTKRIATKNAKREALKFAAERCQYYAEEVVKLQSVAVEEQNKQGLLFFFPKEIPKFEIIDGEIVPQVEFNFNVLAQQYMKMGVPAVAYLNGLEAFAIPFVAGVADDELGFQETAVSFCLAVSNAIGPIALHRASDIRYESCIKLYDCWSKRLKSENISKEDERAGETVKDHACTENQVDGWLLIL